MNAVRLLLPKASRCSNAQSLCKNFQRTAPITSFLRPFSNNSGNKNDPPPDDGIWNLSQTTSKEFDHFFNSDRGIDDADIFSKNENAISNSPLRDDILRTWNLSEEVKDDILLDIDEPQQKKEQTLEEIAALEREEKELLPIFKGPNRAFGDLIAEAGITNEMLDSLIALKDFEGVQGLPPLSEIEELRYEKSTKKSIRAEMERQKLEEAAKARVKKVEADGKAYGTGRRKCSIARVWIQPGDGKFIINDKNFDVYFPMLDHRAALLLPFSETKTLGLWDVKCHVKGGGVSGQVGAIQLGISRALQNFEPEMRPPLRSGGYLTRDPRVVERKKPGKAKARKSFQWVKR